MELFGEIAGWSLDMGTGTMDMRTGTMDMGTGTGGGYTV
jgi:hypothetical protein